MLVLALLGSVTLALVPVVACTGRQFLHLSEGQSLHLIARRLRRGWLTVVVRLFWLLVLFRLTPPIAFSHFLA